MRIISVVTLVSPDGAYGGPTRVAVNQASALRQRGHQVVLAAAARGYDQMPREMGGTPLRLFPARTLIPGTGFAGLSAPGLLPWLIGAMRGADVMHIHAARDLVTLPAAMLAHRTGTPYVLQTHGMIDESTRLSAGVLDAAVTRRVLQGARAVLYLTPRERADLLNVNGQELPLVQVPNGVPVEGFAQPPPGPPEVLFLARLQARKRPQLFVEMAQRLLPTHPDTRFTLVGPDEGEGSAVAAAIGTNRSISWEGAIPPDATLERMRRAAVYVLPSVDEPFPMSVLEAMSLGRPVVITGSCGLAPLVAETGSGIVVDESLESLTEAVRSLLDSPERVRSMGEAAFSAASARLSMSSVTDRLEAAYRGPRVDRVSSAPTPRAPEGGGSGSSGAGPNG